MIEPRKFLLTRRYRGKFTPKHLIFNANLQEFAQRVSNICELEANGQISQQEAYTQIEVWFEAFERSKQRLGIGGNPIDGLPETDK